MTREILLPWVSVSREVHGDKEIIAVRSSYSPALVRAARELGGRWSWTGHFWKFPADERTEAMVREMLKSVLGWDGTFPVLVANVHLNLDAACALGFGCGGDRSFFFFGRQLAWRPARDVQVKLGYGTSVLFGGFESSGGSRKYPALRWKLGTVLRVMDVPARLFLPLASTVAEKWGRKRLLGVEAGSWLLVSDQNTIIPILFPAEEKTGWTEVAFCDACQAIYDPAGGSEECPRCKRNLEVYRVYLTMPQGT